MGNAIRPKNRTLFIYLFFPVIIYAFSVILPVAAALYYSFFEWTGGPKKTFIFLDNYKELLLDPEFWSAFGHNIYLVIVCVIGQIGLALVVVLFINSRLTKFKGIHRTLAFFPSTISAVAIGFIWSMIYEYRYGLLNYILELVGREDLTKVWLNIPELALILVSIPLIWQFIGYYMIIVLSAISSVNKEIFEVAELDGANGIQRALYVVFPLIKSTLLVCMTLCIAGNMKVFDHIFVMTKGGPGTASNVMALYGYNTSFGKSNMGYGSAISIGILVLSLTIIIGTRAIASFLSKNKDGDGE